MYKNDANLEKAISSKNQLVFNAELKQFVSWKVEKYFHDFSIECEDGTVWRITSEDKEEIKEMALIKVWENCSKYNEAKGSWKTWAGTVTDNLCKDEGEKLQKEFERRKEWTDSANLNIEDSLSEDELVSLARESRLTAFIKKSFKGNKKCIIEKLLDGYEDMNAGEFTRAIRECKRAMCQGTNIEPGNFDKQLHEIREKIESFIKTQEYLGK